MLHECRYNLYLDGNARGSSNLTDVGVHVTLFLDSAAWERFSQGISPIRPRSAGAEEEGDEEFGMYFKRLKTLHP